MNVKAWDQCACPLSDLRRAGWIEERERERGIRSVCPDGLVVTAFTINILDTFVIRARSHSVTCCRHRDYIHCYVDQVLPILVVDVLYIHCFFFQKLT